MTFLKAVKVGGSTANRMLMKGKHRMGVEEGRGRVVGVGVGVGVVHCVPIAGIIVSRWWGMLLHESILCTSYDEIRRDLEL